MQWFRIWHDMIGDPKWRLIARKSQTTIPEVISVAVALMTSASENDDRGSYTIPHDELATSLDMDDSRLEAVIAAMQGRFLEGTKITNWEKRQPKREDDSAERVRRFRNKGVTPCNANVTQRNAPDTEADTEADTEKKIPRGFLKKSDSPIPYNYGVPLSDILQNGKIPSGWVEGAIATTKKPEAIIISSGVRFVRHYTEGPGMNQKRDGGVGWGECWTQWIKREGKKP